MRNVIIYIKDGACLKMLSAMGKVEPGMGESVLKAEEVGQ